MRIKHLLLFGMAALSLSSCFKDEAPNAECDITKAWVHTDNPNELFYQLSDTAINVMYDRNDISFTVRRKADVSRLAPLFEITPGAPLNPTNGTKKNMTNNSKNIILIFLSNILIFI